MMMVSSSVSDDTEEVPVPATITFSATPNNQNVGIPTERSETTPKPPSPQLSRSSPERVLDGTQELKKIAESRLFTDNGDLLLFGLCAQNSHIHQSEAEKLLKHSVSLKLSMVIVGQDTDAEGQACFIQTRNGIVMATAKHNFGMEYNKDGILEQCHGAAVMTPGANEQYVVNSDLGALINWDARQLTSGDEDAFKFNSPNANPDAAWKYGKELELIPLSIRSVCLTEAIVQGEISTFEALSTELMSKVEVGMRVGIMANSCVNLLANSMQAGLKTGSQPYKAQRGDTFITVGTISHVGTDHIEYSVNTVPGFSGAPVFLLTPDHEELDMKLIATHAGFSNALGNNFGFLVADKVEQYEAGGTCVGL